MLLVVAGAALGGALADYGYRSSRGSAAAQTDSTALAADVERLKLLVPSQSHTMTDVGLHWGNLWFAAKAGNWPLARFMFSEARQHVGWTVAVRPERRGPNGEAVNVQGMWDAIAPTAFAAVDLAIEGEDIVEFEKEYRAALEACYGCHKASGLPFLRPAIPVAPPMPFLNFDPTADWPK